MENNLLKTILIVVISSGLSTLLINQLNNTNPAIFSFIHKIPDKWKGNLLIRWVIQLILIILVSVIVVIGGLNDTVGTVFIGFLISFIDFLLRKPKLN